MPDSSPAPDLPSTNPTVAYAADVERVKRATIGTQDDAWLTLAHTLWRLPSLTADERRTVLPEASDSLAASTLALGLPSTAPMLRVATAMRGLYTGTPPEQGEVDAVTELVFAVQRAVEELEIAGGFTLAYATLVNLESGLGAFMTPRVRGNLAAQQGRTVRQLGLLDLARSVYVAAMELGYEHDAHDVIARALLGQAVVCISLGNYPAARDLYERALANADAARENELLRNAHHGLMSCGFASGDLDAAMVHGWNVLRLCIHPDARAEALLNMGEVCRLTGELEVALRVFTVAKEWSSIPRVKMHAASSALLTAAMLQRHDVASKLHAELVTTLLPLNSEPYSVLGTKIESSEALYLLGDRTTARANLQDALKQTQALRFHELAHEAEQLLLKWDAIEEQEATVMNPPVASAPPAPRPTRRSEDYKVVLRSLRSLTAVSL